MDVHCIHWLSERNDQGIHTGERLSERKSPQTGQLKTKIGVERK